MEGRTTGDTFGPAYFLDQTDEAATKDVLQKLWMDGAMKLCAEQKYDWCPAQ